MKTKVTKSKIKSELTGLFNSTRIVQGFNIARVCWKENNQYMVIENEETFEDAAKDGFAPIDSFRTQEELIDKLYRVVNL